MHKHDVHKLLEAICCCLQACSLVYFMLLIVSICVLSFIVLNATITQLQACTCPNYNVLAEAICPRLFVVVYKYVLLLFITVVVEYMFMPSSFSLS